MNRAPRGHRRKLAVTLAGFLLIWLVLDRSAAWLQSGRGEYGALICALTVGAALLVERLLFGGAALPTLRALGFGRPTPRPLLAGLGVLVTLAVCCPLVSQVGGVPFALRAGWPAMGVGLLLQNGIGEEVLFRGYLFRRLRQGRTFWRAALLSLVPFTLVHLLLLPSLGLAVMVASVLVAASTSFPLAYLFDRDGTVWAPAVAHLSTHLVKLLVLPDGVMPPLLLWMALSAVIPWLAFPLLPRAAHARQ